MGRDFENNRGAIGNDEQAAADKADSSKNIKMSQEGPPQELRSGRRTVFTEKLREREREEVNKKRKRVENAKYEELREQAERDKEATEAALRRHRER